MFRLPITRIGLLFGIGASQDCADHGSVRRLGHTNYPRLHYNVGDRCGNRLGGSARENTAGMSEASAKTEAPWALHGLVIASILLPLIVLAGGSWLAWQHTLREATTGLLSDLVVAEEQAARVLDTDILLGARVNELIGTLPDEAVRAREAALHERLQAMIAGYSQVTAIVVVGRDGHPLVASLHYPVDRRADYSDREFFSALQDAGTPFVISGVLMGRLAHTGVFSVATRRSDPAGAFNGVILVGVPPSYFRDFDRQMFSGSTDYTAALLRNDGSVLAAYPGNPRATASTPVDRQLMDIVTHGPPGSPVRGRSSVDRTDRLIAYSTLGRYPVHVVVARRWGSVVREWRDTMVTHLIFGIPATLGLFALSLLATRQARRRNATLAQLQHEVERREQAEEALRQSQKMEAIGRLTGGIAHDFNNHLTVISSNIELLQRRLPPGTESLLRLTDAAMTGVQRAATLTHRLLAFSRQQPLEPEPLDVGKLVSDISELLSRSLGEHIAIETDLAGSLWQTRVDANQLENVLLHLAVNARDAMPASGRLTIQTANAYLDNSYAAAHPEVTPGEYVLLAVSDTGCGMPPEVVSKVFDPFFTTKPLGQGTGLGLSMVYGFVRQSGGHIVIVSAPHRGTTVNVYLPRYVRPAPAAPAPARRLAHPPGHVETILVVEDDAAVRRTVVEALRELGYEVLEAPDAMEGVRLVVDRGCIDLLFTDVRLPGGVSGRELADAARSAQPGLRVLLTTGYGPDILPDEDALEEGISFIAKPFELASLAEKIREILGSPPEATLGMTVTDAAPAPSHDGS